MFTVRVSRSTAITDVILTLAVSAIAELLVLCICFGLYTYDGRTLLLSYSVH